MSCRNRLGQVTGGRHDHNCIRPDQHNGGIAQNDAFRAGCVSSVGGCRRCCRRAGSHLPGSIAAWIAEGRDGGTGGKRFGLRWVVPFVRTLFNIIRTGVRMSPFGTANLVTGAMKGLYGVKNGRPFYSSYANGNGKFIQHTAEQILAWTIAAMMFGMVEGDEDDEDKPILITGSRPWSQSMRGKVQLQNRLGMGPYTIRLKLGGKAHHFQYGRYEPPSTVIGITADAIRTIKQAPKMEGGEFLSSFLGTVAEQVESKNFAKGISDILDLIRDPQRNAGRFLPEFVSSFVPNILRQPIRVMDPVVRETSKETAAKDLPGRMLETTKEGILPTSRAPAIDLWGNVVKKEGTALSRLAIPQRAGKSPEINRVDQLLLNWIQQNPGQANKVPQEPRRSFQIDGETYYMNDEEYTEYTQKAGKLAFARLRRTPLNIDNPNEDDIDKVRKALESARATARNAIKRRKRRELSTTR